MLPVCLMFKIALLWRDEMPQRSAFVAEKVQQIVVCNQAEPDVFPLAHTLASESESSRSEPGSAVKHAEKMV